MNKNVLHYLAQAIDQYRADRAASAEEVAPQPKRHSRARSFLRWLMPNGGTLLLVALLILTQNVWAGRIAAPSASSVTTIPYQGRLADVNGDPVTGRVNMEFRLYDVPTGGTPLWQEFWTGGNSVNVSDGLFSVMLGSINPTLIETVQGHSQLYLEITVGTDDPMAPRVQLGSVPFSVWSLSVADNSITADKIASGAVGSDEIATDAVGSDEIATDAVGSDEIATDAVDSDEIASGAVGSDEIATDAVGTTEIANASITAEKLADGAVTDAKLSSSFLHLLGYKECDNCGSPSEQGTGSTWIPVKGTDTNDIMEVTVTTHGQPVLVQMTSRYRRDVNTFPWCGIAVLSGENTVRFAHIDGDGAISRDSGCSGSYLFPNLPAGTYTFQAQGWVSVDATVTWVKQRQIVVYEFSDNRQ